MAVKNSERFSELEFCMNQYFNAHIASIMDSTQKFISNKCAEEIGNYSSSFAGIVRSAIDDMHGGGDTSLMYLQMAGEWNSKTTDDYLDMVRKNIAENKDIQKDLVVLSNEWRKAVISEVGRKAYDEASKQIGTDLSYAYIEYRMEKLMLERLAKQRTPSSSMEYILTKAAERSIFGLPYTLKKTATDFHIDDMVEERYKPTTFEEGASHVASFGMDAVSMGGFGSWGALVKMAGAEVVFSGAETLIAGKKGASGLSVEECISRGLFRSESNVFGEFRKNAGISQTWEHPNIISLNKQLTKKMKIMETKPPFADYMVSVSLPTFQYASPQASREGIPSIVAIGMEDDYREFQKRLSTARQKKEEQGGTSAAQTKEQQADNKQEEQPERSNISTMQTTAKAETKTSQAPETNLEGWDSLLGTFGLNDFSAVGSNLGYVIAMLPDVLLGAFIGRTKSLGLEDNLLPIASVIAGLFIKNPLLKMTLIGLGGANLLNKAGHEALGTEVQPVQSVRYKHYADEPLDPRITGLRIQGNMLICAIDKVPSTISLPKATVDAYEVGALPLNTLANAVLARHDAMQGDIQESLRRQYESTAREQNHNQGIR